MKLGLEFFFLKIPKFSTIFGFSSKTWNFCAGRWLFRVKISKIWFKVPSLARSVPKPLKVPSLARSVHKPLKVPSLVRFVLKPLKEPTLERSVPKPLSIFALHVLCPSLSQSSSSIVRYEGRLPQVNWEWKWKVKVKVKWKVKVMRFGSFDFYETYIYY